MILAAVDPNGHEDARLKDPHGEAFIYRHPPKTPFLAIFGHFWGFLPFLALFDGSLSDSINSMP